MEKQLKHTFRMAYSTQPPFVDTNSFSASYNSSHELIGNVNRDRVRKAVKFAV